MRYKAVIFREFPIILKFNFSGSISFLMKTFLRVRANVCALRNLIYEFIY